MFTNVETDCLMAGLNQQVIKQKERIGKLNSFIEKAQDDDAKWAFSLGVNKLNEHINTMNGLFERIRALEEESP